VDNIIFFDGQCNLCNKFVQLCIAKDTKNKLTFCSLQNPVANNYIAQEFISNNKIYQKSDAALHIIKTIHWGFGLPYYFIYIPKFIRDFVYDWIAKNRYKWFGKQDVCWMPTIAWKEKFL
jgi:predicted DCC family thiol-disulfide oxidoreductase YuxK